MSTNKILKGIVTLAIVVAILFLIWYFWRVVIYVLLSAVLAIMGRPLVSRLVVKGIGGYKFPRTLAAAVTLVVIWIVAGTLCALFIPLIFGKIHELASVDWSAVSASIQQPMERLHSFAQRYFSLPEMSLTESLRNFIASSVDINVMGTFSNVASALGVAAVSVFSVSFITFYFLKEDGLFYRIVALFFPDKFRSNVFHALDSITALLSRYFGGLLVESAVIMAIITIAMLLWGMSLDDALVIGLIMGVMNLIPYAGPVIGCFVSACAGVLSPLEAGAVHTVVVIVSTIVVVKLIDDFIIQPTLYSERVQAHPLEVFMVILVAGYVAGVWGMLLAIPLYTVLRVFAREFFSEYSLVRHITGQMTE